MGQARPLFVYFRSFHMKNIAQILYLNNKSVDGMRGTRTRGSDEYTELLRHPKRQELLIL